MSTKTTIFLVVVFGLLLAGFFVSRTAPKDEPVAEETDAPKFLEDAIAKELVPNTPDDVNRVVCRRAGSDGDWVFEREVASPPEGPTWRMTAPIETKVAAWDVQQLIDQLLHAKYKISQRIGENGRTAADFGLDAPQLTVTFSTGGDEVVKIEVGSAVGSSEAYARLADSDVVATISVRPDELLKSKAYEYRDTQLWNVAPENITRLEIVEHSLGQPGDVSWVFRREGAEWLMESPVSARATAKVTDAVNVLARLRTLKWVDAGADKLAVYGLQSPALTASMTVSGTEGGADEVYVLHVSARSPIGEDTKVYVRAGDEPYVGQLMKTSTDKLRPVMTEWRDMTIVSAPVQTATGLTIEVGGSTASLVKQGNAWFYEPGESPAERQAVQELLDAVAGLKATAFVEDDAAGQTGFDSPQAVVTLTIPGRSEPARVVIGAYTDQVAKRLVYLSYNEGEVAAKVRVQDVEKLLRAPAAYHDLTVFSLPAGGVEKVTIDRKNRLADGRQVLGFSKIDGGWMLISPVEKEARGDALSRWVTSLAGLRAEAVAAVDGEPSAYGLADPIARISFEHKPPVQFRMEEDPAAVTESADGAAEPAKLIPVEVQPPNDVYELVIGEKDGVYYARRSGSGRIYRMPPTFAAGVHAAYVTEQLLTFDEKAVTRFSIRHGELVHEFERADGQWRYASEPDLPLHAVKVQNLLLQLRDIKSTHHVVFEGADLGAMGLDPAAYAVEVELESGPPQRLSVADRACPGDPAGGHYATLSGDAAVVLVPADVGRRLKVDLDELGKP
jgi:hypothetical protein